MGWKHLNKVGIELEGGWNTLPPHRMKGDGSVRVSARYVGEVASAPLGENEWRPWLAANHPHKADGSCGLHVHVSLKTKYKVMRLMDGAFQGYLLRRLERWAKAENLKASHRFWARLRGGNHFCQRTWNADGQISGHRGDRYTQVNFCAYAKHGTVEFRVLPQFLMARTSESAIACLIEGVESYLSRCYADKNTAVEIVDDTEAEEVRELCV